MATNPKMAPCPKCGSRCVTVYKYDSGWCYVECDDCFYRGHGEGSVNAAIKSHNAECAATAAVKSVI